MIVSQLIQELQKVKNKDVEVYIFVGDEAQINSEIMPIDMVDDSMDDRVDLNMGF